MSGLRIIAGRHKGRMLAAPAGKRVRPTAERAREALFNMLVHGRFTEDGTSALTEAQVLDAYAGTGALGLEALSRGAAHATLMDEDAAALAVARRNAERLDETARVTLIRGDPAHPPRAARPCAVAFLDPPYGQGLAAPALAALKAAGWLKAGALVAVETGAQEDFQPPQGFETLEARRYGAARLVLLRLAA